MTPEQWTLVEQLYHDASSIPLGSRGAWLATACGGDDVVRREVESLLAQNASSDELLESGALAHVTASHAGALPLTGLRIGGYEILDLIDEGGMGQVYRARDLTLPRDVAVKVIPPVVAHDPVRRARLRQEAELLASLSHPHIAHVYAFVEDGERALLVMELVPGRTLAERIARGPIQAAEALPLARQIADALDAAHEQGVVHRDLKPANIKITPDGSVKVLDFGLAAPVRRAGSSGEHDVSSLFGTAAYLSPERARGESEDRRGDIWAFGCVFFEMLAGRQAYSGATVTEILTAILERDPDWTAMPASIPDGVRHLLRRCLDKDPRRRLRDIGEARVALDDLIAAPPTTRPRSNRRLLAVAAAAVIAVAGFAAWRWQRAPAARPTQPRVEFTINLAPIDDIAAAAPEDPAPAASPDGTRVLFRTGGRVNARWWIRSIDSTTPLELPVIAKARLVQWSPDGTRVVWCADNTVWTAAAIAGGASSRVVEGCGLGAPSWSRRGAIIFAAADGTGLKLVPEAGGKVDALTTVDREHGESWHRFPVFLPDATHYVYLVHGSNRERTGIYLGTLGESTPVRLMAERSRPVVVQRADGGIDLVFVVRGNLVLQSLDVQNRRMAGERRVLATNIPLGLTAFDGAYSASDRLLVYRHGGNLQDRSRLLWFARSGAQIGEIDLPAENGGGIASVSLSADQQQVLFSLWAVDTATINIWSYDLRRNVAQQLLHDDFLSFAGAEWAPDAKSFVYASSETGQWEMREHELSGADRHLAAAYPYQYASSGRFLLVAPPSGSAASLSTFDRVSGSTTPVPGVGRVQTALSPDERWLAYSSRAAGQSDIYVQPFPVGAPVLVSTRGGVDPRWREDGRELYYINNDGWIVAVPFAGSTTATIGTPTPLFRIPVPSGYPLVPSIMGNSRYAPAGKGRRFLISVPIGEPQEVRVVTNWRENLASR